MANCPKCNQPFKPGRQRRKYCSQSCAELARLSYLQSVKESRGLVKLTPARHAINCAEVDRDKEYDEGFGKQTTSVYEPRSIISVTRDVACCVSCRIVKPLINGYCDACRTLGANEKQVLKPRQIQARAQAARHYLQYSPWRFGLFGK